MNEFMRMLGIGVAIALFVTPLAFCSADETKQKEETRRACIAAGGDWSWSDCVLRVMQ